MRSAYETPPTDCPYCGAECEADWCDVGVGMVQCGPYHCEKCLASEAGPYDDYQSRKDYDPEFGWYLPCSPAGSTANVDGEGNVITHIEADDIYRATYGVGPRRWTNRY